jgi:hypothetical protein
VKDWKKIVGAVAPTLATALGGPLAGVAAQTLSAALLGKEGGDDNEIAAAVLTGGVDGLEKIKRAEADFQIRLRELDIDLEKIHQADRASARDREAKTGDFWTLRVLSGLIVGSFVAVVWEVLFGGGSAVDSALAGSLIGYLSAKADMVAAYYFGSSAGSERKTELLARKP